MYPSMPGFIPQNKRTVRAPVNPMDKATIVSIFPKPVAERKDTIQPGFFSIPAGSPTDPQILIIGPSSWWREVDEEQPLLEIPQSSIQVADSVVKDYCNSVFLSDMSTQMPGLFYVPGCKYDKEGNPSATLTKIWVQSEFKPTLNEAIERQKKWYGALLKAADSLWSRSNGNPLVIDDNMRIAAKELGVEATRDWMKDYKAMDMVKCKFCGNLKNPDYPVCMNCRIIDPSHPLAKDVKMLPRTE